MASSGGSENLALNRRQRLEDRLFAEPYSFEFFQAVRLLRRFYPNQNNVGLQQPPRSEIVRFGAHPSLSFPASEIQALERRPGFPPLMRVNFMGVVGPQGLLPIYYTELVIDRLRAKDSALRDFLDIFHHRIISLFYRVWQKYRFQVAYENGDGDQFSQYLLSLIGMGAPALQHRQELDDNSFLCYAGLIAQQPRSALGLELILLDYFGVPANVEQFLGAWYSLDETSQCNLDDTCFDSQRLGFGAVAGDEIWSPQSRVRIVLGPLSLKRYLDFLPSGSAFRPLRTVVRFYAGDEFDFEVQLILRREEAPACELGAEGDAAPQLGWLSWSKTKEMQVHPSQAILQLC
jgi:type VI secretion system protein ImpH